MYKTLELSSNVRNFRLRDTMNVKNLMKVVEHDTTTVSPSMNRKHHLTSISFLL